MDIENMNIDFSISTKLPMIFCDSCNEYYILIGISLSDNINEKCKIATFVPKEITNFCPYCGKENKNCDKENKSLYN